MRGLRQRCFVVTGGASGIGAATVARLREEGAQPVVWDRSPVVEDPASLAVDVTDEDAVRGALRATLERHGRVDGLVNCAGTLGRPARLVDQEIAQVRRTFAVNTESVLLTLRHVAPVLADAGGGAIVNVSSNAALHARPGLSPYAASKAAVLAYTRTAARELARDGIRVNAVCPGGTETPMMGPPDEGAAADLVRTIPMRRFARPEEIAATIVFLLSDDASYVTGATLVADGGATL